MMTAFGGAVLDEEGFFDAVDEASDAFAAVGGAPNEMGAVAGREFFAMPVGFAVVGGP